MDVYRCRTKLMSYFSFPNFAGQASQEIKELGKERKEKESLMYKEKTRNQLANLDENLERKKLRSNLMPNCWNEKRSETMERK